MKITHVDGIYDANNPKPTLPMRKPVYQPSNAAIGIIIASAVVIVAAVYALWKVTHG
jgi:hypothetical protein